MSTTEATRPDLTGLTYEDRVCIAVAETQGATWIRAEDDCFILAVRRSSYAWLWNNGEIFIGLLPDYLNDPAAWGALMEKELARWERGEFDGEWQHRFWYPSGDDVTLTPGPWRESIGEAASLAVCVKHGKAITPSTTEAKP